MPQHFHFPTMYCWMYDMFLSSWCLVLWGKQWQADRQTARITPLGARPSSAWTGREEEGRKGEGPYGGGLRVVATLSVSLVFPSSLIGVSRSAELVRSPLRERESRHFPTRPAGHSRGGESPLTFCWAVWPDGWKPGRVLVSVKPFKFLVLNSLEC